MGRIYRTLGRDAAHRARHDVGRWRAAYAADVTYVTAKEVGFDFLRDSIVLEPADRVQRPFAFALVDEADSLLIDEARLPLVMAAHVERPATHAERIVSVVRGLAPDRDFETDEQRRNIALTDAGAAVLEEALECGNLHQEGNHGLLVHLRNALHAEHLLTRDVDYIVRDGRVELVETSPAGSPSAVSGPTASRPRSTPRRRCSSRTKGRVLARSSWGPRACASRRTWRPS